MNPYLEKSVFPLFPHKWWTSRAGFRAPGFTWTAPLPSGLMKLCSGFVRSHSPLWPPRLCPCISSFSELLLHSFVLNLWGQGGGSFYQWPFSIVLPALLAQFYVIFSLEITSPAFIPSCAPCIFWASLISMEPFLSGLLGAPIQESTLWHITCAPFIALFHRSLPSPPGTARSQGPANICTRIEGLMEGGGLPLKECFED